MKRLTDEVLMRALIALERYGVSVNEFILEKEAIDNLQDFRSKFSFDKKASRPTMCDGVKLTERKS